MTSKLLMGACACALLGASSVRAEEARPSNLSEVVVPRARPVLAATPATVQSLAAPEIAATVNAVNVEDALKYLPDILVRKRHIGDTQAPITTRTSGLGASARSLIYADGVLLSALIGNNNSNASPRWGMVSAEEVQRIEVLYGPFSAAFPGNSIGAVVQITTRTPARFEATAGVETAWQGFDQYGTKKTFETGRASATLGDRWGRLGWFLSASHLDSESQPLAYVTAAVPPSRSTAGAPATGGYADFSRTGAPVLVLGAGGFEHQLQDNAKLKLALDLSPSLSLAYTAGLFRNQDHAGVRSYLSDAAGAPAYAGALNIGGAAYTLAASAFSNNLYRLQEDHWMQSLSLGSKPGERFDWQAIASLYDYAKDEQRTPTIALPAAQTGGAGVITRLDGTGWRTLDLKAGWRPSGAATGQAFSFGAHHDRFKLNNPKFATADWIAGDEGPLSNLARGKTETDALWLQDDWSLAAPLTLTLGARYEHWRAFDGLNYAASPALSVSQPELEADRWSPKASLAWRPDPAWTLKASYGVAYRFPTVTELYQTVTTGPTLSVPNPDLRPERARSGELSAERADKAGSARLSLFEEHVADALISQSAPLAGSTALFNYVQNIDQVRSHGVEAVVRRPDVLVRGLELSASITYVDSRTARDAAYPVAVGKRTPQVPRWRATAVASWRVDPRLSLTLAARYSDRIYSTIDNTDVRAHAWQGFDAYFVVDARVRYQLDPHWAAAVGVDNLNDRKYFLFHPFPQRTVTAELRYAY